MNLILTCRTNYFGVTDRDALKDLLERTVAEDTINIFDDSTDPDKVAFGCYGSIYGLPTEEGEEDLDAFLAELQRLLVPGDAVILQEAGHEGLRYIVGAATIITKDKIVYVSMDEVALATACDLLGTDWSTRMDY